MGKMLSGLSIFMLILLLMFSVVGCGSSGGGGGDNDGSKIEGYWKVQSFTQAEGEPPIEFPYYLVDENVDEDPEIEKISMDMILSLNNKKYCEYKKYTYVSVTAEQIQLFNSNADMNLPEEPGVYYNPDDIQQYSISGNNASYSYTEGNETINVTLKFAITGDSATIVKTDSQGKEETITAIRVTQSAVDGAKEHRESE